MSNESIIAVILLAAFFLYFRAQDYYHSGRHHTRQLTIPRVIASYLLKS